MEKTSKQVTKDPKRQERAKTSRETYMKRLKEAILRQTQLSTSPSTGNSISSTSCSTGNSTVSASQDLNT